MEGCGLLARAANRWATEGIWAPAAVYTAVGATVPEASRKAAGQPETGVHLTMHLPDELKTRVRA